MLRPTLLVLFLLAAAIGCADSAESPSPVTEPQACIDRIVAADSELGGVRNHASETVSLGETIRQYVSGLEALDFSACPPEFTTAFETHLDAWKAMEPVAERYPDLRGELHDLFDQIEASDESGEFGARLKAIWDTWAPIQAVIDAEP